MSCTSNPSAKPLAARSRTALDVSTASCTTRLPSFRTGPPEHRKPKHFLPVQAEQIRQQKQFGFPERALRLEELAQVARANPRARGYGSGRGALPGQSRFDELAEFGASWRLLGLVRRLG